MYCGFFQWQILNLFFFWSKLQSAINEFRDDLLSTYCIYGHTWSIVLRESKGCERAWVWSSMRLRNCACVCVCMYQYPKAKCFYSAIKTHTPITLSLLHHTLRWVCVCFPPVAIRTNTGLWLGRVSTLNVRCVGVCVSGNIFFHCHSSTLAPKARVLLLCCRYTEHTVQWPLWVDGPLSSL